MKENTPNSAYAPESADSEVEVRAKYILGRLGFSWEELKGKRILDIGAGPAEFGAAARKKGINIISLDRKLRDSDDTPPYQNKGYILGSAEHLPFADESFDIVMSHASIPLHAAVDRNDVLHFIEEIRRVLKRGGECRFGPVGVGGALFPVEDSSQPVDVERTAHVDIEEEVRKTSLKTTALLRELIPNLQNSTDDPMAQRNNFYSFRKESAEEPT